MQTPKPRPDSLNGLQKQSLTANRAARKLKTPGSDPDSSPNPISKTPKDRITKITDRRSPRVLASEKKRSDKVSELESQITELQEELKKAKHQLRSSNSWSSGQQEAEDAKKQLAFVTAELEETRKELSELSECENVRIQELRKISQDRDRAWQSELEAVQKQHELDTTALASAINEMRKLKMQLDRVYQSEASQARQIESAHAEVQSLQHKLTENLALVEKLKTQMNDSRASEARSAEEVKRTQMQLEILKAAEKTLQEECANSVEAYNSLLLELEQSKYRVNSLEELVGSLQADREKRNKVSAYPVVEGKNELETGEYNESEVLRTELSNVKNEVSRLRAALTVAERRYQDQQVLGTTKIRDACELMVDAKPESTNRAAELETKLIESRTEVEELRTTLIEKEKASQSMSYKNNGLTLEAESELDLKKSDSALEDLKARLLTTEVWLQSVIEENKMLKSEIMMREKERSTANEEIDEAATAAEHDGSMKIGSLTQDANQGFRKSAQITEQLDAAQAGNFDMEAELKRLKVQCDQWRKAAEAATAMLSTDDHDRGKYVEKTGLSNYQTTESKVSYSQSEDTDDDDESPKKRNGNMLKRIGVLWKKGQKFV